jgi:hypothetical protein
MMVPSRRDGWQLKRGTLSPRRGPGEQRICSLRRRVTSPLAGCTGCCCPIMMVPRRGWNRDSGGLRLGHWNRARARASDRPGRVLGHKSRSRRARSRSRSRRLRATDKAFRVRVQVGHSREGHRDLVAVLTLSRTT